MQESWKRRAFRIVQQRQLCSCMNDTKRRELCHAMRFDMPFPPPFTMKTLFEECQSEPMQDDYYLGDLEEPFGFGTDQFDGIAIEWIRIHPRLLVHRGRLISPQLLDASEQLEYLLHKHSIPFAKQDMDYLIYGDR